MRYRYRTDEELKDSGVEWIGKIPKDYKLEPLKKYFMFEKGRNAGIYTAEYVGKNEGKYPVYSGQTENEGIMGLIDSYEYDLKQCLFTTTVGAKVMTVLYLTGKFTLSQNCLIMINNMNNVCTKYAYYYLQELFRYEKSLIPLYMQPSLRIEDLKRYKILIQNLREQEKIANFLDKKTSQFDSIISKKEKLIEKLEEAKKSLISEVVTGKVKVVKTDDGYELVKRKRDEMKDSGVEWLGDIPKDWEVKRIKYVAKLTNNKIKSDYFDKYIGLENIEAKTGRLLSYGNSLDIEIDMSTYFDYKNILFGKLRPYLAKCIVTECRGICSEELLILRADKILPEILKYIMLNNDFINLVNSSAYGAKMPRANWNFISNIKIPIMSDYEQIIVEDFINNNSIKFDTIINKTKTQIEKLKEAKQSLISEAVTGKIEILD